MDLISYIIGKQAGSGGSSGGRDWSAIGYSEEPDLIKSGYEYAKEIYDNWVPTTNYSNKFNKDDALVFMPLVDTSNGTNFVSMFMNCSALIYIPILDTSNGTNFSNMFNNCLGLTAIPQLNTSNGTNFNSMFNNCRGLTAIAQLNTSNGTDFASMFVSCSALTTIPQLNTSNGTSFSNMFNNCTGLTTIPQLDTSNGTSFSNMFNSCRGLTNLGGFINLGQAYSTTQSANYSNYRLDLSSSTLLTHESLMNVINNLYDIATKGCNTQSLVLGATNLKKLTAEEIAIATTKGWTVS